MLNLVLFLSWFCGILAGGSTKISYIGQVTGSVTGPWNSGDKVQINFTLAPGPSGRSSGGMIDWGFGGFEGSSNATAPPAGAPPPLVFSNIQYTLVKNGVSNPTAFNSNNDITNPAGFSALALATTAPSTIEIQMTVSPAGMSSLNKEVGGIYFTGIQIFQDFGIKWPTTASDPVSFFNQVAFNQSTLKTSPSAPDMVYFSTTNTPTATSSSIQLTPQSLVVTMPRPGDAEEPEIFDDIDSFKAALSALGITFGKWDPTKMNITITGLFQFGSYTYAFYTVDDGELGPVSITLGVFKIKKWGDGVSKGALGFFGPSDVAAATGFTFTPPSGLTEVLYHIVARFSKLNVVISAGDFNLEITGKVKLSYFNHYKTGDNKGKKIGKDEGKLGSCDSPNTLCFSVTLPSTSTVSGLSGSNSASALSKSYTVWALLVPAFLYVLW